jgi:hypothetical protein
VARYRLRFVLQEFDLPHGITIIGRSLDCHLTIEDPLVSRRHARIVVGADGAYIEDAGSRNGVKLNGTPIKEPTLLSNGDRVRIGTQDFVFCCVDPAGHANSRTTGQLRLCANCHMPYPRELLACPNCEATEQTDEDTLTGSGAHEGPHAWTVQLLVEALERALRLGRVTDAERLARRASAQVEELVAAGRLVDVKALASLAVQATATSLVSNDPTWAIWAVDIYGRTGQVPPLGVVESLFDVARQHRGTMYDALGALLERLGPPSHAASQEQAEALRRLEQLHRTLRLDASAAGDGSSDAGPAAPTSTETGDAANRPWPGAS